MFSLTKQKRVARYVGMEPVSKDDNQPFIAKEKFCLDSKEIKFSRILYNFFKFFLEGEGKIEKSLEEEEAKNGNLLQQLTNQSVQNHLGRHVIQNTSLAQIYDLLKRQPTGSEGGVLSKYCTNFFYVQHNDKLFVVMIFWRVTGWSIDASPHAERYFDLREK